MIFYSCVKSLLWLLTNRLLLTMKLIVFLTLLTVLKAAAGSFAQTITLEARDQPLSSVMQVIKRQSGYHFFLKGERLAKMKVNVSLERAELNQALDKLTKDLGVDWIIKDKVIILRAAAPMSHTIAPIGVSIDRQERVIAGQVVDGNDQALDGVTVTLKGTTVATTTDPDGRYRIKIPEGEQTLVYTILGYNKLEQPVGNRVTINATLTSAISGLDEVVVVGYGTQKKADLTGSIASADMEALSGAPNVNLLQALQGTVPGLNIGMTDEAGENPSISVRGRSSLSGNQNPLIILDGIMYYGSLNSINPNDIKSVDILKDASSKAIYGAQAANGVILITTKSGINELKPLISYTGSYAVGEPAKRLHTRNREEYLDLLHDIFWKDAYTAESGYTQRNENFNILQTDPFSTPIILRGYNEGADTDWWKLGTTDATIQRHNISIQGASNRTNYFLSLAYDKQQNYIINDRFDRKTARINIETQLTDWLNIGTQTFGSFADFSGDSPNITQLTQSGPLRMPYDENGNIITEFGGISNPLIPLYNDDVDKQNELFGNLYAKIKIPFIEGLTWNINYGNTLQWVNQYNSNPFANVETGEAQKYNSSLYTYTFDNIINYARTFSDRHVVDATFVVGKTHREFESTTARAVGLADQSLGFNDLSQGITQFTLSNSWEENASYQMLRLNYSAFAKYALTATMRRDGFSGFAKNEKIAYFPSIALAWTASEESFLKNYTWLDLLKLRASYGVNGNLVARYSSLAKVTSSPAYVFDDVTAYGHSPNSLSNPNLKWERTYGINVGLDFGILKNRISGNIEYYSTTTRDLIWNRALPILTGFSTIIDNIGEIDNRGWELSLNFTPLKTEQFNWDVTGVFSQNKNRINRLLGDVDGDGREDDLVSSNLFIGQPIGAVFDYEVDGIYQLGDQVPAGYFEGSYRIVDTNQDGVLSAADRTILGMRDPLYRFSIHNHFRYKNFSLKVFLNAIQGGRTGYLGANEPFGSGSPQFVSQMGVWEEVDFWTPNNQGARFRSPAGTSSINPTLYQSRNFVRLQDVILSYAFDSKWLSRLKISKLNVFLSGKNLLTWTKWDGWDPETTIPVESGPERTNGLGYDGRPVMRYYTAGIELSF
jgi:TonB-dependent starch-binding outer membrane protein SusC